MLMEKTLYKCVHGVPKFGSFLLSLQVRADQLLLGACGDESCAVFRARGVWALNWMDDAPCRCVHELECQDVLFVYIHILPNLVAVSGTACS